MDGTTPDAPTEYVGWKPVTVARKFAGVPGSEDAAGAKLSREIAFTVEADALPLSAGQCARSYTAQGKIEAESTINRGQGTWKMGYNKGNKKKSSASRLRYYYYYRLLQVIICDQYLTTAALRKITNRPQICGCALIMS